MSSAAKSTFIRHRIHKKLPRSDVTNAHFTQLSTGFFQSMIALMLSMILWPFALVTQVCVSLARIPSRYHHLRYHPCQFHPKKSTILESPTTSVEPNCTWMVPTPAKPGDEAPLGLGIFLDALQDNTGKEDVLSTAQKNYMPTISVPRSRVCRPPTFTHVKTPMFNFTSPIPKDIIIASINKHRSARPNYFLTWSIWIWIHWCIRVVVAAPIILASKWAFSWYLSFVA